jgi:hypothetical protein
MECKIVYVKIWNIFPPVKTGTGKMSIQTGSALVRNEQANPIG